LAAALHLLGGFIQIAMLSGLACAGFVLLYHRLLGKSWREVLAPLRWLVLGPTLGLFLLLPLIEAMQGSVYKNVGRLGMIPMPYANVIAFFFPRAFGDFFQSWIPGHYPNVVDWDNLFAFAGTFPFLLILAGLSRRSPWPVPAWRLFVAFAATALFLQLRYINVPPVGIVNLLPILGRQSPKHAACLMVFTTLTAAAFALQHLRAVWSRRAWAYVGLGLFAVASSIAVIAMHQGGWAQVDAGRAHLAFIVAGGVVLAGLLVLHLLGRGGREGKIPWL